MVSFSKLNIFYNSKDFKYDKKQFLHFVESFKKIF